MGRYLMTLRWAIQGTLVGVVCCGAGKLEFQSRRIRVARSVLGLAMCRRPAHVPCTWTKQPLIPLVINYRPAQNAPEVAASGAKVQPGGVLDSAELNIISLPET